jgi:hypothetical protein
VLTFFMHSGLMNASEQNWKVLLSLLLAGWQQAARDSGAVTRLRGFLLLKHCCGHCYSTLVWGTR